MRPHSTRLHFLPTLLPTLLPTALPAASAAVSTAAAAAAAFVLTAACAVPAWAAKPAMHAEIKRTVPSPTSFLSTAVTVPAGAATTYMSGVLADLADKSAPPGSPEAWGDTKTQAMSVLMKLKANLEAEGLGFGDVVSVRVFLVGDPKLGGKLDFAGLQASYTQFFGTADQPNRPVRTAVQVAALPAPGALVEIDCIAAKAPK